MVMVSSSTAFRPPKEIPKFFVSSIGVVILAHLLFCRGHLGSLAFTIKVQIAFEVFLLHFHRFVVVDQHHDDQQDRIDQHSVVAEGTTQ